MASRLRCYSIYFRYGLNLSIPTDYSHCSVLQKTIRYATKHFQDRRGAALLRYKNRAEITVLMCEQKPYHLVWFRVGAKAIRYGMSKASLSESRSSTKRHVIYHVSITFNTCLAVTTLLPCTSIPNASDNLLAGVELNSSPR